MIKLSTIQTLTGDDVHCISQYTNKKQHMFDTLMDLAENWPSIKEILLQGHLNETIHPSTEQPIDDEETTNPPTEFGDVQAIEQSYEEGVPSVGTDSDALPFIDIKVRP